jgi:hypothetical protein
MRTVLIQLIAAVIAAAPAAGHAGDTAEVRFVREVPAGKSAGLYVGNRAPLRGGLLKLPIGSIEPKGWIRHMLELERDGMMGRLMEISPWLNFESSSWASKEGKGERGWEELPYWLKGFGDLGYVLKDEKLIAEARKWIEAAMASQREDGYFGPRALLTGINGKPDLWPHMVMLNILQSYHEFTGDRRAIEVMTRYMKWENSLPPSAFGEGYWPKIRAGDNIESAHWLYNRTGEAWLLDLAKKIHDNMAPWHRDVIDWHNVNLAQGFRAGTVFWPQSGDPGDGESAERNHAKLLGMYGQFPGGGFVGDENCRPGYTDPRGGIEACGIVEFMHSFQMLTRITGKPVWADRCEEIAFNSFPASMPPDQKGLHYITSANQVQLDRNNKSPGIQNGGTMFSYSPFQCYRCCQHNVSHGWPYYAEELWLATADGGLCASLYGACEVKAKVGAGAEVRIVEETDYPFGETVNLKIAMATPAEFTLYLRIPRWCEAASAALNGKALDAKAEPLGYLAIARKWTDGDAVELKLPMRIAVRKWEKNKDAVSVDRGPLSYSLKIEERWQKYGTNPAWPEWEVFPASDWNYGLALDAGDPTRSFEVAWKPGPMPAQPWTADAVPIVIRARARKIPSWTVDRLDMVAPLQQSPARTAEPIETVTLIPMGAARLRIATFPTTTAGPEGHEWTAPPRPKTPAGYRASASHCFGSDQVEAIGDGLEPSKSNDGSIIRFTWWPHQGTREWVQYDFAKPTGVSGISVYWFDDTGTGKCRVPASAKLLHWVGDAWQPVPGAAAVGTAKDAWNGVSFPAIQATRLRIEVELQKEVSAGILEWKVTEAR